MSSGLTRNDDTNPSQQLRGFHQAIFVLEQLCKRRSRDEVVEDLKGDKQLVDLWMNFLIHNHWITLDTPSKEWVLTEKGKRWIDQINNITKK